MRRACAPETVRLVSITFILRDNHIIQICQRAGRPYCQFGCHPGVKSARSQSWATFVTGTGVHHLGCDGISLQIAPLEILDERDCCIYVHFPHSKIYLHDKTRRAIWGIMCKKSGKKSSLFDGDNVQWCVEKTPTINGQ